MKKEEVKQEHKDNEGDPQVKGNEKTLCTLYCKDNCEEDGWRNVYCKQPDSYFSRTQVQ